MDPTTLGFTYDTDLDQWTKYHGMGYYQVLIIRDNDKYQVKLVGGSNAIERQVNQLELEQLISDPLLDMLLDIDQLREVLILTEDSSLATQSCRSILGSTQPDPN